jgi:hypothetical protein
LRRTNTERHRNSRARAPLHYCRSRRAVPSGGFGPCPWTCRTPSACNLLSGALNPGRRELRSLALGFPARHLWCLVVFVRIGAFLVFIMTWPFGLIAWLLFRPPKLRQRCSFVPRVDPSRSLNFLGDARFSCKRTCIARRHFLETKLALQGRTKPVNFSVPVKSDAQTPRMVVALGRDTGDSGRHRGMFAASTGPKSGGPISEGPTRDRAARDGNSHGSP